MCNRLQAERFVLPSPPSSPVQNLRDFAVTVVIQQSIDLGNHLRLRFPDLELAGILAVAWLGNRDAPEYSAKSTPVHIRERD